MVAIARMTCRSVSAFEAIWSLVPIGAAENGARLDRCGAREASEGATSVGDTGSGVSDCWTIRISGAPGCRAKPAPDALGLLVASSGGPASSRVPPAPSIGSAISRLVGRRAEKTRAKKAVRRLRLFLLINGIQCPLTNGQGLAPANHNSHFRRILFYLQVILHAGGLARYSRIYSAGRSVQIFSGWRRA